MYADSPGSEEQTAIQKPNPRVRELKTCASESKAVSAHKRTNSSSNLLVIFCGVWNGMDMSLIYALKIL